MKDMKDMKETDRGVCAARGFKASGVRCGIKASSAKRDIALLYSEVPCAAAGLFTTNRVKAASVLVCKERLAHGSLQAVVANSGNANACTGAAGLEAARRMTEHAGAALGIPAAAVAVASTGVIGVPLPDFPIIAAGIDEAARSLRTDGNRDALEAVMTTDTVMKEAALAIEINGVSVRLGGMAKGAGMIHPNMATMLCFITTDVRIAQPLLDKAFRQAVNRSFNRITVDGDMSTNDTALVMANGAARNPLIDREDAGFARFCAALEALCVRLAKAIAQDGEGASRLVTVTVRGAASEEDAAVFARAVASSSLVKAACFGADANWGRVLAALGRAGPAFNPAETAVAFAGRGALVPVADAGAGLPFSEQDAKAALSSPEIGIEITLGRGPGSATAWGCDLTYDYVRINGDYRS
jgi:glutamate N-acetyltransferase/amino-acid N-acetyltransferase